MHVNATSPTGLDVEFDITFPNIPCALLSIDAADPTGQSQSLHIDRTHRVWKHRMDKLGNEIGHRSKFELGATMSGEEQLRAMIKAEFGDLPEKRRRTDAGGGGDAVIDIQSVNDGERKDREKEEECGSCYGAGDESECCNTCDDVKRAYRRRGWHIADLEKVRVCRKIISSAEEVDEGCNIHGIVALSSGGGNVHIAPGRSLEHFGHEKELTINDVLQSTFEIYNVTHTVNKLHFGTDFPGNAYQLDGQERLVLDKFVMYQYYIQVVPTMYKFLNGTHIQTNQFSATEHMRYVQPGTQRGLPGVFFFYELSPLHVEFEEYRLGWTRFLTSVCAVVGGVFTVMGMLDQFLFTNSKAKSGSRLG